jgi:subtilisin-like proprotein convertase family protein
VFLLGLTHPHPEDLKILLVAPDDSRAVVLMGHAGGGGAGPVSGLRLMFVEGAPAIPQNGMLTDGGYKPADYSTGASLPLPAPPGPYSTNLATFKGMSPDGDWKLYVLDDIYPTGGSIDGWELRLQLNYPPTLLMQQHGSGIGVSFKGPPNSSYGIQGSVDLETWTDSGSTITGSDGIGKFDIQVDTTAQARFYRVVGQ